MRKILLLPLSVLVFFSCSKKRQQIIPAEFQPYVEAFFSEGAQRGFNLELDDVDLIIEFGSLSGTAGGQCSFGSNTVTIDQDKWNQLDEHQRVWLIFHELGHCVLDREHRNQMTNNEECLSVMKGMENGFECSLNYYSAQWWDFYLDELFGLTSGLPEWYNSNNNYESIDIIDSIYDSTFLSNSFAIDNLDLTLYNNFNIDFSFENYNTNQPFVKFYLGNIGFSSCDLCTGTNVQISSDSPEKIYYQNYNGNIQFNSNVKLTIRKFNDKMFFFINERFIHSMEASIWQNSTLFTIPLIEEIQMRLLITTFE